MQSFRQMMELFNLNTLSYSYVLLQGIANSELLILHPRTHGLYLEEKWFQWGRGGGSELVKLRHQENVSQGLELWISQAAYWGKY